MEEYLDIVNEKGEKTGRSFTYDETHKRGLLHRTVHVWFINSQKQLLLQKRSKNKRAYPDMWDVTVGGHISAGQTSLEAAQRETEEEIGQHIPANDLKFLFTVRQPRTEHRKDFIDEEFNDVYVVKSDGKVSDFTVEKDEVDEVKWVDLKEFALWTQGKGAVLVPHPEEYKRLLEILK